MRIKYYKVVFGIFSTRLDVSQHKQKTPKVKPNAFELFSRPAANHRPFMKSLSKRCSMIFKLFVFPFKLKHFTIFTL